MRVTDLASSYRKSRLIDPRSSETMGHLSQDPPYPSAQRTNYFSIANSSTSFPFTDSIHNRLFIHARSITHACSTQQRRNVFFSHHSTLSNYALPTRRVQGEAVNRTTDRHKIPTCTLQTSAFRASFAGTTGVCRRDLWSRSALEIRDCLCSEAHPLLVARVLARLGAELTQASSITL